jgi:NhaP-type Na+/H+ or K+/H+ antiporter
VEHGLDTQVISVVAGCIFAWAMFSALAGRFNVTAPIAFVALGAIVGSGPLALVHINPGSVAARGLAEITLGVLLFADASRLNPHVLRADAALPARLLLVGLPLTIAFGALAAWGMFRDLDVWVVALIASAVAPTDAALGAQVVEDERVPGRIRRTLNVESGLNDGIATPIVTFCVAGAVAQASAHSDITLRSALGDLGIGLAAGVVIGTVGGWLLKEVRRRGWSSSSFEPIGFLALALLAYAATIEAGGNGFVGAFVGGMTFGAVTARERADQLEFTAEAGELLAILVWFLFGTVIVPVVREATWRDVVYAVLSLTVVRMLAVALALAGTGLDGTTVAFIGWFGPRGLASVVFALIAFDELAPQEANRSLTTIAMVVLFSVVLHGLSAGPFAARYGRSVARLDHDHPARLPTPALRARTFSRSTGGRTRTAV